MKNTIVFTFALSVFVTSSFADASEFVIAKQPVQKKDKRSKNTLKQEVADAARDVFSKTRLLTKHLGRLQQKVAETESELNKGVFQSTGAISVSIASVQKNLTRTIENLLDNKKPFKKATRIELSAAQKALNQAIITLESHKDSLKKLHASLKKTPQAVDCKQQVKNNLVASKLGAVRDDLSKIKTSLQATTCLRV